MAEQKRKKKYKGFDFYEDQLEEIARVAEKTKMTQADIVRAMTDKMFNLPKKDKE